MSEEKIYELLRHLIERRENALYKEGEEAHDICWGVKWRMYGRLLDSLIVGTAKKLGIEVLRMRTES